MIPQLKEDALVADSSEDLGSRGGLNFSGIQERLREFAAARDWEQFHDPKNLSIAMAVEASEVLELFQWLTPEQSKAIRDSEDDMKRVQDELADVLIYAFRLADILGIDLPDAVRSKIDQNEHRYSVHASRGDATKYSRRHR
jgi:NTP pyrophosphatase (non-canonical NTP hydrolase)